MTEYICELENFDIPGNVREEVVRCRDCKFYEPDGIPSAVYPDRFWCDKLTFYMQPNGFCSWGCKR